MSDKPSARRYDLLAALVATFVSVLALFVSAYSTYWQRQQTRAMTWPRLTERTSGTLDGKKPFIITLTNGGTGPLEMHSLVVLLDGAPVHDIDDLVKKLTALRDPSHGELDASFGLVAGLSAGEQREVIHIEDEDLARLFAKARYDGTERIQIRACYCSLLDECWRLDDRDDGSFPVEVRRCDKEPYDLLHDHKRK